MQTGRLANIQKAYCDADGAGASFGLFVDNSIVCALAGAVHAQILPSEATKRQPYIQVQNVHSDVAASASQSKTAFPLKASGSNRYLAGQNNVPFLMVGDGSVIRSHWRAGESGNSSIPADHLKLTWREQSSGCKAAPKRVRRRTQELASVQRLPKAISRPSPAGERKDRRSETPARATR